MNPAPQEFCEPLIRQLNRRALFRDTGVLLLVKIVDVSLQSARLSITLECLDGLMLHGERLSRMLRTRTFSGIREDWSIQPHVCTGSGQGCSWYVLTDEPTCEAISLAMASQPVSDASPLFRLADFVARHPAGTPVPSDLQLGSS